MRMQLALTHAPYNSKYAPLAALAAIYRQHQRLDPLAQLTWRRKKVAYALQDKLIQVLVSILAGCAYLSEVNTKLSTEGALAEAWGWPQFADQSTLARCLDQLTQIHLDALAEASLSLWRTRSRTLRHNWRGYLWLDLDLSGLPSSARAEGSRKGFFSDKKTSPAAN
jgi:hypothetical protein